MPAKRKVAPKKKKEESEEEVEEQEESETETKSKKAKTTSKKSSKDEKEDNEEGESEGEYQDVNKIKPKKSGISGENGLEWTEAGTLLILDSPQIKGSAKIASFDMDDTLITPKSGAKFAKNRTDWRWLFPEVPKKLKELHKDGWKIIIFTNQAGIEKKHQKPQDIQNKIVDLSAELGFPLQAFVACATDANRKPHTTMWEYMVKNHNGGEKPDKTQCVFVGDAAGRVKGWKSGAKKDFSCTDRCFANNIGITFKTPEEYFLGEAECKNYEYEGIDPKAFLEKLKAQDPLQVKDIIKSDGQELVLMVGMPASGKSTFARKYFVQGGGYTHVNMDTLKTKPKCLKLCREALSEGKSVVVDNTNPSSSARKEYTSIADELDIPYRCFVLNTDPDLAHHLNFYREHIQGVRRIPDVGYNMFKKNFQAPTAKEGFKEIRNIEWIPDFPTPELKEIFMHRTA